MGGMCEWKGMVTPLLLHCYSEGVEVVTFRFGDTEYGKNTKIRVCATTLEYCAVKAGGQIKII